MFASLMKTSAAAALATGLVLASTAFSASAETADVAKRCEAMTIQAFPSEPGNPAVAAQWEGARPNGPILANASRTAAMCLSSSGRRLRMACGSAKLVQFPSGGSDDESDRHSGRQRHRSMDDGRGPGRLGDHSRGCASGGGQQPQCRAGAAERSTAGSALCLSTLRLIGRFERQARMPLMGELWFDVAL